MNCHFGWTLLKIYAFPYIFGNIYDFIHFSFLGLFQYLEQWDIRTLKKLHNRKAGSVMHYFATEDQKLVTEFGFNIRHYFVIANQSLTITEKCLSKIFMSQVLIINGFCFDFLNKSFQPICESLFPQQLLSVATIVVNSSCHVCFTVS